MSAALKYISCPVSQLDLLEPIGVQTQVDSFKDIEYLPTSAIQDGAPITFEIGKDERYTDASEFVIKTVVEIQGENGSALTGKQFTNAEAAGTLEKVGVINNLGHSLWEQIVLLINDTKVTESSNNYAYKAMLETLLSYDDVDEKSVLRLSCFKKDHGNVTADCPTATHANSGLVARSRYFEGGKKVTLITRPRIDLCQQPRYIPDQCKMLLKLTPSKSSFVLMSDKNDAKYQLKIHSCTLMVRRIKLVEASKLALQSTIESNHQVFRYPLRHVKMKSELLTSGSSNFEFDNQFFGHIPNRLTMCTVENRAMYGVFKENPFHFKHNNLETLTVSVDSDTLIRLDFDFDNGNYVEAYDTLMRSTGQYKGGRSMLVDYHDFGNGTMILVFDLTARGECNSEQFTVKKLGNLRINLKYKNALTETNNLILYGESDGVLTIDADRNVFTDYL